MSDIDALNECRNDIDRMQRMIQERVESADLNIVLPALAQQCNYKRAEAKLTQRRLLKGHFGKVYSFEWCPASAHHLVSASQDGKLIIWNALSNNKLNAIPLRSAWVMTCAYSTSGQLVACGGLENICYIYKIREYPPSTDDSKIHPSAELAGHEGYLSACKFLSDERILTSSGDSTCMLWDINRRTPIQSFPGHYGDVMTISVSNTNRDVFISGSVDASVKLWDIRAKSTDSVKTFRGHESDVNSVAFFPDGNAFGTGSDDSTCRLFDIRSVSQVSKYFNDRIMCGVTCVGFSHSGRVLFAGYDDQNCMLWDTATAANVGVLPHENRVSCLGVSPDGKALCTGSWDSYLRIWA